MNVMYRIYTQNKNRSKLIELTEICFQGFTLYQATGYWQGKAEKSLIVEVIADRKALPDILELSKAIKIENDQDAVILTIQTPKTFKVRMV